MKVKDFIKKYRMCSNSSVFVQSFKNKNVIEIQEETLKNNFQNDVIGDLKLNTFSIIDNVLTIYTE